MPLANTTETIEELIQQFNNDGRTKTFAEFLSVLFKGKYLEIYMGDSYEEVSMEQISQSYPAVFCGKVIGAYRECLILNSVYTDRKSKKTKLGNLLIINERAIRALNEIDGHGIMGEMFLRSEESLIIKEHFVDQNK